MNPVTDIVFSLTWILLLVWAVRSVISGWRSKPVRDFNAGRLSGTWTTEVVKPVHPEMKDVEPGTKLLGVNFEKKTECDLEEYRDLQARIEALRVELEGDEDEDDDEEEGGLVVRK
tara:strand:+ start:390 stop:737 length:348 start_codon:yes stop_codon:yes gene_type:complete